ncbi:MAG: DUF4190 domain-containing protein [Thermoguttaceae bacterium]
MKTEFDDALKGIYSDHDEVQEEQVTEYKQIAAYSVGSLVFGFLSIITFLHWSLAVIPLIGIVLGVVSLRKIMHAPDEIGGFALTTSGIALCVVCWLGGYGWLTWNYFNAVPAGYTKIDFSELVLDPKTKKIPEHILQMAEKDEKIFVQGYMTGASSTSGIVNFVLVRTKEHCKFCSPTTNPADMITVHMTEGRTADYRNRPIRVGGTLKIDTNFALKGSAPYHIEADVFR